MASLSRFSFNPIPFKCFFFFPAIGREGGRNSAAPAIIDPQSEHIWRLSSADLFRFKKLKKKQQQGKRTIFEIKNTYFQWADFGKYKRDQRSRKKKENPFTNCRVQVRTKLGFLFIWPSSEYLVLTSCNLIFDKQASIISACGLNNLVRLLIYSLIAPFRNKINRQIRKRFVKDDAG